MSDVLIIGAGITGLSCARTLRSLGIEATILESSGRAGGVIRTERINGYLVEAGPTSLLPKPETLELFDELGLSPELVTLSGPRYIYSGERLRKVPFEAISVSGLLRVLAEPLIRSRPSENESVRAFFRRRFGSEAADRLVAPFVMGIYAGNADQLGAAAAFPRLVELERNYGSVAAGLLRSRRASRSSGRPSPGKGGPRVRTASFKHGLETLPRRLAQDAGIEFGVSNVRLSDAKTMVVTAPAHRAVALLEREKPALAVLLKQVEYSPMIIAATAIPDEAFRKPPQGFGFLVPRTENMHMLGSIFTSALFPDRAPPGRQLFSSFLGGAFEPEVVGWPDGQVWDTLTGELRRVLGSSILPEPVALFRYERALPQYKIGHERLVAALRQELSRSPGLFIAGNYVDGISLSDCIEQGQRTARAVAEYLRRKP